MFCVDTTFVIDFFKKRVEIDENLEKLLEQKLMITPFSIFELYDGLYKLKRKRKDYNFKKKDSEFQEFIKIFEIINYNFNTAKKTAEISNYLESVGKIIDIVDIMIASTAIVNKCSKIITRNEKHFKNIPEIKTISYNLKKTNKS